MFAIYGPESQEPFRVKAEVHRDDSEGGLALHFVDVPKKTAHALEKLVACLPDIESLEEEEGERLGAIISEIVSDIDSSR